MTHSFGDEIKEIRKSKNLTLQKVADRSGISQPYLSQLENGRTANPSINALTKLAKGLDITYAELFAKVKYLPKQEE